MCSIHFSHITNHSLLCPHKYYSFIWEDVFFCVKWKPFHFKKYTAYVSSRIVSLLLMNSFLLFFQNLMEKRRISVAQNHLLLLLGLTLKDESSSSASMKSWIEVPICVRTRSMTCTTPFVAIWFPWMIRAQFTVTTCNYLRKSNCRNHSCLLTIESACPFPMSQVYW